MTHRITLSLIRNRFVLGYAALLFLLTFGFVLGFISLARLNRITQDIEDGQRGNTCILLIQPQKRTKENVTRCIDNNRHRPSKGKPFHFNVSTTPSSSLGSPSVEVPQPMPTITVKSTPDNPPHIAPKKPKPIPEPKFTTRINALGQQECQYIGYTAWELTINGKCP